MPPQLALGIPAAFLQTSHFHEHNECIYKGSIGLASMLVHDRFMRGLSVIRVTTASGQLSTIDIDG